MIIRYAMWIDDHEECRLLREDQPREGDAVWSIGLLTVAILAEVDGSSMIRCLGVAVWRPDCAINFAYWRGDHHVAEAEIHSRPW